VTVIDAVRETLRRHAMLAGGERVLVAVSGGADSVALLHALRRLAPELALSLAVAHVHHGLRPEADADAELVEALCRAWALPATVARISVVAGTSIEAAARAARYAALTREAERVGAQRIAVGHTADDQAETVLMRVLEGAGPRGLAGIPPVRGRVIRPLIEVRRVEIVAELERAGLAWREDASNRDPRFLRARVRHQLIPHLRESYNPAIVDALVRVASLARAWVDRVEAEAKSELAAAVEGRDEIALPAARLRELPEDVGAEVVRLAAARLGYRGPMRAWAHRAVRRLLRQAPRRRRLRLHGLTLEASGGQLRLASTPTSRLVPRPLAWAGVTALAEVGLAIQARHVLRGRDYAVPREPRRVAFDADRLAGGDLGVRSRRPGDRFVPFGETRPRRLKSLLIAAGVPRWDRDRIPLVVAGDAILWVAGVRRSACAPVTETTCRVLELSLEALARGTAAG
jgi:tRNA(Ile)-lysidine synthase